MATPRDPLNHHQEIPAWLSSPSPPTPPCEEEWLLEHKGRGLLVCSTFMSCTVVGAYTGTQGDSGDKKSPGACPCLQAYPFTPCQSLHAASPQNPTPSSSGPPAGPGPWKGESHSHGSAAGLPTAGPAPDACPRAGVKPQPLQQQQGSGTGPVRAVGAWWEPLF